MPMHDSERALFIVGTPTAEFCTLPGDGIVTPRFREHGYREDSLYDQPLDLGDLAYPHAEVGQALEGPRSQSS